MQIKFDRKGNLQHDLILQLNEFEEFFGYNTERKKKINNLFTLAKILSSFSCALMYIVGSFITAKRQPNDIDVCFDITELDEEELMTKHPELLERETIHRSLKIHIFFIRHQNSEMLDWFKTDRDGNKRGIVKIFLKDIPRYDKK
jgi:hypothetical protein